jgi:excisionase family DNA binding protein
MTPRPWLTTTEAAPLLGVSRSSAWRMANGGSIPAHALLRTGRWVRISRAWIMKGKVAA